MMEMVAQKLTQMGGTVELVDVGEQEVSYQEQRNRDMRVLYIVTTIIDEEIIYISNGEAC